MNSTTSRRQRETVLIVLYGDGYVEAYAEKHIDVRIQAVPFCPGSEVQAEDIFELMLPRRYRQVYWPNLLRASAMHLPLSPSTIRESRAVSVLIKGLNQVEAAT